MQDGNTRIHPVKSPYISNGVNGASNDIDQIDLWWDVYPNAMIGINCEKSGLGVIDVDVKHGASFREEKNSFIVIDGDGKEHTLPKTYLVKTMNDGYHFYYSGKIKSHTNILKAIDTRGDGGYIIAPPSQSGDKSYEPIEDYPIVDFPQDFLPKISKENSLSFGTKYQYKDVVNQGERHSEIVSFAGHASNNIPLDDALVMGSLYNERFNPPLPDNEVKRTIIDIYEKHERERLFDLIGEPPQDTPNHWEDVDFHNDEFSNDDYPNEYSIPEIEESSVEIEDTDWKIYSFDEMMKPVEPRKQLIEGLIVDNSLNLFYGQFGTGKTYVALHMGMCIANGTNWLGRKTLKKNVLFIDEDNGRERCQHRLQHIANSLNKKEGIPINTLSLNGIKLDNDCHIHKLEKIIEKTKTEVIIIDVLRNFFDGKENDSDVMSSIMNKLRRMVENFGVTIIVLHHTDKLGENYRGSSAIAGAVDLAISLKKINGTNGILDMSSTKNRDMSDWKIRLSTSFSIDEYGNTTYNVEEDDNDGSSVEVLKVGEKLIYTYLKAHPTVNVGQIQDYAKETGICKPRTAKNTFYDFIKLGKLIKSGLIENGNYQLNAEVIDLYALDI